MLYFAVVAGRVFSSSGESEFLMHWAMRSKKDLSGRKEEKKLSEKMNCKILLISKYFKSILVLISLRF